MSLTLPIMSVNPSAPPTGYIKWFANAQGQLCQMDENGTVSRIGAQEIWTGVDADVNPAVSGTNYWFFSTAARTLWMPTAPINDVTQVKFTGDFTTYPITVKFQGRTCLGNAGDRTWSQENIPVVLFYHNNDWKISVSG